MLLCQVSANQIILLLAIWEDFTMSRWPVLFVVIRQSDYRSPCQDEVFTVFKLTICSRVMVRSIHDSYFGKKDIYKTV